LPLQEGVLYEASNWQQKIEEQVGKQRGFFSAASDMGVNAMQQRSIKTYRAGIE
jgi:hypothetical protein